MNRRTANQINRNSRGSVPCSWIFCGSGKFSTPSSRVGTGCNTLGRSFLLEAVRRFEVSHDPMLEAGVR